MPLQVTPTEIPEVLLLRPDRFTDGRGFFQELYHADRYAGLGIGCTFVQDNLSRSSAGVLRGMHYQLRNPQAKLVAVIRGEALDVAVDIRRGSPTFGRWVGRVLSDANQLQLFIPEGFAHGFCVLSESVDFLYKCSALYTPGDEVGFHYASALAAIEWPVRNPTLSARDAALPRLEDLPAEKLPVYTGA